MDDQAQRLKFLAAVLIFIQTILSGLIPICCGKRLLINPKIISIGNCVTAGIFLAMGLSHILYEAREDEESIAHSNVLSGKLHLHVFIGTFVLILGVEAIISADEKPEDKTLPASPVSLQDNDSPIELEDLRPAAQNSFTPLEPLIEAKPSPEKSGISKEHRFLNFVLISAAMGVHSMSTGLALGVQGDYNSALSILIGRPP
jgi:zinc transporter ZupT